MTIPVRAPSAGVLAIALVVFAALVGPITAAEWPETVLKGEHLLRPGSTQFAEFEAARSRLQQDGRVSLQMHSAPLGPDAGRQLIDRVRSGSLVLAVVPLTAVGDVVPLFRMFEIPFLFSDSDHMRRAQFAFDHSDRLKAREEFRALGLVSIGWLTGESLVIASHRPLLEPGDLRGLKVARTSAVTFGEPSATERLGRKLGFAPVRSTRAASTLELQSDRVDAFEIELSELAKHNPKQMFVSITDHLYGGYLVIANSAHWAALPDDVQTRISNEIDSTDTRIYRAIREATFQASKRLREQKGVTLISLPWPVRQNWREATHSESLAAQAGDSNVAFVADDNYDIGISVDGIVRNRIDGRIFGDLFGFGRRLGGRLGGGGRTRSAAVTWNAWFEVGSEVSQNDVPVLEVNGVYRFNLDLARYAYRESHSAKLSTTLEKLLAGQGERILLLHPVLLGDELTVAPGKTLRPQEITVRIDRARQGTGDLEVLDAFDKNQITTRALSQAVNLGGIVTWDIKAAKAGCGGIAVTVWDQARSTPLDYLVLAVQVRQQGKEPEFCVENESFKPMTAGLRSMLEGPSPAPNARTPDVALHVFETLESGHVVTHAVLLHRRRLLASLDNLDAGDIGDTGVYSWQLASVLGDYLSMPHQLPHLIKEAHQAIANGASNKYPYEEVARELALKIFSGQTDHDRDQAGKARAALLDAVDNSADPSVVVRFVSADGKSSFIPLGLLAAGGTHPIVSKRFTVIQPLLQPRAMTSNCVEAWSFARPKILEGVAGEALKLLATAAAVPVREPFKVLPDHPSLVHYLLGDGADSSEQGEGLIILAHHSEGYLRYNDTDRPPARIAKEYIERKFKRGSAAVVAACTTVGSADENSGIVDRLISNNVDTLIVSPFAVDAQFGTLFALEFEKQVVAESARKSGASILSLFEQAAAKVTESYDDRSLRRDMALEFVLVGDPDLRLCK